MKFMGSKRRIAKDIIPIMLSYRESCQTWVEPFVGGGNIISMIPGRRIGSDVDVNVIDALVSIRDHISDLPKNKNEFTEDDYRSLRGNEDYAHRAYAGFAFSYGGKWLGGWCRDAAGARDYVGEAYRNATRQSGLLDGVDLIVSSYYDLKIPDNSLVYCDPPYASTTSYGRQFDHNHFWQWCRGLGDQGHIVFISEYAAPHDFECIWEKEISSSLTKETGSKVGVERLFKIR